MKNELNNATGSGSGGSPCSTDLLRKLHEAAVACYNGAFDYAKLPRERDVLPIINEVEEFLSNADVLAPAGEKTPTKQENE